MYDPDNHHRRSIRLRDWDYASPGLYFVTICTQNRACLFGEYVDYTIELNARGEIVDAGWIWLVEQYPHVQLDAYVIMPNHLHGIIGIDESGVGAVQAIENHQPSIRAHRDAPLPEISPKTKPLGGLIGAFKTRSTRQINSLENTPGRKIWQRNYYESIVRNERHLNAIRDYIVANPAHWPRDQYYQT